MDADALRAWESFYVIVGSSGAALTGLQFVVATLISESERPATSREISAFGTPTVIHFCAVLFISAVLSAPWRGLSNPRIVLGIIGLAGIAYSLLIIKRARAQTHYKPVFEDWLFHAILPFIAYASVAIASFRLSNHTESALFAVAASALLLLFIGIHNSWDTVTYITIERRSKRH
jgi:hypothetical protein